MRYSDIALIVWVFLVSIAIRGWAVKFQLSWWILAVAIVYIVLRLLEWRGKINRAN